MKYPRASLFPSASLLLIATLSGCSDNNPVPPVDAAELKPGGDTTISTKPLPSFAKPAANLPAAKKESFHAGNALALQPWVKAPSITDIRDGLGPLYNTLTCLVCHVKGGRGHMPNNDELMFTNFLRLSLPGFDPVKGVIPEPMYGDQLQSQSTSLAHQLGKPDMASTEAPPEGQVYVNWVESTFSYSDGDTLALRKPQIDIRNLGYGPMHPDTLIGIRNAPPIHGVGLLQLIDQNDLDALADPADTSQDGVSGRINITWDFETNQAAPGRFGLKANKPNVRLQVAGALQGDMGISNPVFPDQPCTAKQLRCLQSIHGNDADGFEISRKHFNMLVDFNMSLAVPARRDADKREVLAGRSLFYQSGCAACHHPDYVTGKHADYPHLSRQHIWPYTDLLLHDMGEELADGRPDYLASGAEWRTAPLWGVGLSAAVNGSKNFLHDGRARSIEEAIVWHGGEAEKSKNNFVNSNREQRRALIAFVESL